MTVEDINKESRPNADVPRFIVVEGPIGVGKTSLARRLADSFAGELILDFQQNAGNLLKLMLKIEDEHGRERADERWGPRTLDLDLLLYGNQQVRSAELDLPHPGIAERNFVLLPLDELAPHLEVPGLASVHRLKAALSADDAQIEKLTKQ